MHVVLNGVYWKYTQQYYRRVPHQYEDVKQTHILSGISDSDKFYHILPRLLDTTINVLLGAMANVL